MCGIFSYSGHQTNAAEIVVSGLKRLDYRGYDSWGVAVASNDSLTIQKKTGKISEITILQDMPSSSFAIAHTRWATTGNVTDINAHPHTATDHSFTLAQNGIVENYQLLKNALLKKGYTFISETDTEVIVRLIEESYKYTHNLKHAVTSAFQKLTGRNTIILLTKNGDVIAARNGSPLVIGINKKTNEIFLSSDTLSFANQASHMIVVDNGQLVYIDHTHREVEVSEIASLKTIAVQSTPISMTNSVVNKGAYDYFMLKEIHEAPFVLRQLIKQDKKKYESLAKAIKKAKNVYTLGSGGAGVAAAQVAFYLREFGKIRAVSLIGADAVEYQDLFTKNDLIITISQSGETADVLEVLEAAKIKSVKIASFVNMPGSMISRLSDYPFMSESGPEICVMSTKTFDAQIAFGYLLAKTVVGKGPEGRKNIEKLAMHIERYLCNRKNIECIQNVALSLEHKRDIFLLGKYQNFQIIREGMVKIIEATYKHGHALPSGDLKHYVITLMEPGVAVVAVISNDKTQHDVMNAVDEVKLRGAEVFGISPKPREHFAWHIPVPDTGETSAMMNLIPLQLLAYYLAKRLGNAIDKPRNIAKSVTVK